MGRHSPKTKFTQKFEDEFLDRLRMGESVAAICQLTHMPALGTIYRYLQADEEFALKYAKARAIQAEYYVDKVAEIADATWADMNVNAANARVAMDGYRWMAAKLSPQKYNDAYVAKQMLAKEGIDTRPVVMHWGQPQETGHKLLEEDRLPKAEEKLLRETMTIEH
jgi:hypothetical protein